MESKTRVLWGASMGVGVASLEAARKRVPKSGRILDAGCGMGFVISALPAKERHGIDSNPAFIETAKKLNPKVDFSVRDAVKTGFKDGFFDTVICLDVVEHTQSQRALIAELSRVLSKGGRLLISTPLPEANFLPGAESYTKRLHKMWGHKRLVSRKKLILMLDEAGLRVEDEVYYMHLPARVGILVYNVLYALTVKGNQPENSIVLRAYERLLSLLCKFDNATKLFGPFEVLFVAVKD
jgi:2-polyprenyl-3-methyl-5-hydroxy-6-metoxy-1,4-benzoquinol methylase